MSDEKETYIKVQIVPMEWEELMFEEKDIKEVERMLDTNIDDGLTEKEAERRYRDGANELVEEEKKTVLEMFIEQLLDPWIYVLMGAGVISAFLGEWQDTNAHDLSARLLLGKGGRRRLSGGRGREPAVVG